MTLPQTERGGITKTKVFVDFQGTTGVTRGGSEGIKGQLDHKIWVTFFMDGSLGIAQGYIY